MKELRIMVVDDSAVNRRMLIRLLQRHGIGGTIAESVDGVDYLEKMGILICRDEENLSTRQKKSHYDEGRHASSTGGDHSVASPLTFTSGNTAKSIVSYDICIVDNHMPRLSGTEAVEHMRRLGYEGLIVGVTGDGESDDLQRFLHKGANYVLAKPMRIQDLVGIINRYTLGDGGSEGGDESEQKG